MTKARRIALFNLLLFKMTETIKMLTFIIVFTLSLSPPDSPIKPSIMIMAQNQAINNAATTKLNNGSQQLQPQLASPSDPIYNKESTMLLYRDDPTPYFQSEGSSIFNNKMTYDEYLALSMKSLLAVAGFDNDLHRYDNRKDLVRSIPALSSAYNSKSPSIISLEHKSFDIHNSSDILSETKFSEYMMQIRQQQHCDYHLGILLAHHIKLTLNLLSYSHSTNLNIIELFDSFGAPQESVMRGSHYWLGSYDQCLSTKLSLPVFNPPLEIPKRLLSAEKDGLSVNRRESKTPASGDDSLNDVYQMVKTRYCIANFRSPNWINNSLTNEYPGSFSIKIGVCLPETCNSLSFRNFRPQLEKLIKSVRLTQLPYSEYHMIGLYCLPDERSELRQLSMSAKAFIVFIATWATLVIYYTVRYEFYLHRKAKADNTKSIFNQSSSIYNLTLGGNEKPGASKQKDICTTQGPTKMMRAFSLRLSWNKLFDQQKQQKSPTLNKCSTNDRTLRSSDVVPHERQYASNNLLLQPLNFNLLKPKSSSSSQQDHLDFNNTNSEIEVPSAMLEHQHSVALNNGIQMIDSSSTASASSASSATTNRAMDEPCGQHIVDLSAIDGIKVISMIWLIAAHSLLFFIRNISNGRDFWSILKDARFTTIMAGIFPVDTFFTITGILTAYLKFRKDDGKAIGKVRYWLDAFVHRYFRFVPMYLIVYWYIKEVSQYVGSGPLWDYATANTSLRSVCKEESWTVPIFFGANFKPLNEHCVKPAWYLANDFQYLLVTPVFLGIMMKSQFLGYAILTLMIFASLALQFLTVFYSNIEDFEVLANFKPMFGTYVLSNLWKLYVLPYNRIPPYLIGLLTGHLLYSRQQRALSPETEITSLRETETKKKRRKFTTSYSSASSTSEDSIVESDMNLRPVKSDDDHDESGNLEKVANSSRLLWSIIALISIIYLPLATNIVSQHGLLAKIVSSSLIAAMRLVWSLAIARLIFVCAVKQTHSVLSRFLSSPLWKPWSKVGLPALLIQWEIIIYLAQTQRALPDMNIVFLMGIILITIVVTYLLAVPVHLAFENPWSAIERLYIHPIFEESRSKSVDMNDSREKSLIKVSASNIGLHSHRKIVSI